MRICTQHPLALTSADHTHPRGIKQDNTRCPKFVDAVSAHIGKNGMVLDMGCAGGGLVKDFLDRGYDAHGVDGSDYAKVNNLGEWPVIPDRLHLADITKPFQIGDDDQTYANNFKLITSWEVMEHIKDDGIDGVCRNVRTNMSKDGLWMMSVATFEDRSQEANWHVTVKPRDWWIDRLVRNGFRTVQHSIPSDAWPRGSGNPLTLGDWIGAQHGFHLVVALK